MRTSAVGVLGLLAAMIGGTACSAGASAGAATEDAGAGQPTQGSTTGGADAGAFDAGAQTADAGGGEDSPGEAGTEAGAPEAGPPATPGPRVVAYLPNYAGSYSSWAQSIDFSKMTHLNLAFATATTSNGWDMGASDSDVQAIVTAAHAAGVQVFASLGGGGGDQTVVAQYQNASNVGPLVASLDSFVAAHDFDGVDIDIEDPNNLGSDYTAFVNQVVAVLRPEGKIISAAVAEYLQSSMDDSTLHTFDFVNDMIYSTYSDSVNELAWYTGTKNVPADKITLGAAFFGSDASGNNEYAYSAILAADPNAWSADSTQMNGETITYTGMASMKKLADYSKGYGGIMFWDLSQDVTNQYSLYKVIQGEM